MDQENKDQVTEPGATHPEGQPQGSDQNPTNPEDKTQDQPKTYTEEELQSITDKRVSEAIRTREENLKKQISADIEKRVSDQLAEERKKAKMKADELAEYEKQKLKEEAAQERAKREELEKRIAHQELVTQVVAEKKMDARLGEFLTGETLEDVQNQADVFNTVISDAITAYYKQNSRDTAPGNQPGGSQPANIDTTGKSAEEVLAECQIIE